MNKEASFIKHFVNNTGKDILRGITGMLASFNPDTAGQADIDAMEERLTMASMELGKAQGAWVKEQKEADAAQKSFDERVEAARVVKKRMEAAIDETEREKCRIALDELTTELLEEQAGLEREKQEALEAKSFVDELSEGVRLLGQRVKEVKKAVESAKRDAARAANEKEVARARAEQAARMAGLRADDGELGVAISRLRDRAEADRAEAAGLKAKSQALGGEKPGNDIVADALKQVRGAGADDMAARMSKLGI